MSGLKSVVDFAMNYAKPKELAGRILELLVGYPIYALSFLFPRSRRKWVFGTNVGFTDNAKYLFLEVLQHGETNVYWISPKKEVVRKMRSMHLPAYYRWSFSGLWHCLTASVYVFIYFSNDINFFTSGRAKKVNLWHGVGIKNLGGSANDSTQNVENNWLMRIATPFWYEKFSLFLSTSPLMNEHFKRMFSLNDGIIYEGMYPRCSFLQMPIPKIKSIIDNYEPLEVQELYNRFKTYKKVFLYMPTWRSNLKDDFLQMAGFDFEQLNAAMKKQNSVFVFKLHPAVRSCSVSSQNLDHVLFMDSKMDVYPLLPFTDVLITDYSSIYYDYLLMEGKKVLLFPFDLEEYRKSSNHLAFDYETYMPGVQAHSFDKLLQCLADTEIMKIDKENEILKLFWGNNYVEKNINQLYNKISNL